MVNKLPEGWRRLPLPEVIDFREGPGILARDFTKSGVPLIRLAGLNGDGLLTGCNYLDPAKVATRWAHFRVARGDTLLSTSASLGRVARVDGEAEGAIPYTGIIRMRPRGAMLDSDYVEFVLRDPSFVRQVRAMGAGSVMQHFGPSHLRNMTVVVPPRSEQRAIADVLGALDDKIECNERATRYLQDLNMLVFSTGATRPAALGPDRAADSGGGYRLCQLGDLAEVVMGQSPPGASCSDDPSHGPVLVQGMSSFGDRHPLRRRFTSQPTKLVRAGVPIMTVRAPVGAVNVTDSETVLGRGVAGFVSEWPVFLEHLIRSLEPRWAAVSSGTIFPAVNRDRIASMEVVVPDEEAIRAFEADATPRVRLIDGLLRESRTLAAIRDALLPKLVSGQIRVPLSNDPEEQVGAAVEALGADAGESAVTAPA